MPHLQEGTVPVLHLGLTLIVVAVEIVFLLHSLWAFSWGEPQRCALFSNQSTANRMKIASDFEKVGIVWVFRNLVWNGVKWLFAAKLSTYLYSYKRRCKNSYYNAHIAIKFNMIIFKTLVWEMFDRWRIFSTIKKRYVYITLLCKHNVIMNNDYT